MGGVQDGQAVSAGITNPAFIFANDDDFTVGSLGLENTTHAESGFFVENTQRYLNNIAQTIGLAYTGNFTAEADSTGTEYDTPTGALTNGQTYKQALTALSNKFDSLSSDGGHTHSGAPGDGPLLNIANLGGHFAGMVPIVTGGSTEVDVAFSSDFGSTNYSPLFNFRNEVDSMPIFMQGIAFGKTSAGFKVLLNAPADTVNYTMEWSAEAYK